MYLRRLELLGFKTFAAKTVLEFSPESATRRGLTAVVGPNGSGKSNIADAIRWVMGEQSMKLLRGKKSEDVIFSGSQKKSRSGFAEVTMTLENDTDARAELPEIVITRRLYRDGKSEYEINRRQAKLADVALLLAQSGVGQRTYSVIGQGMVDAVLSASPSERKEFFDDAAGLRPLQLKRHQSVNKLDAARDNLRQTEALLREIGPRLSTLERHMKRLKERDELERDKAVLERSWYGGGWHEIFGHMTEAQTRLDRSRQEVARRTQEAAVLERELAGMEQEAPRSKEFDALRKKMETIAEERAALLTRQAKLTASIEIAKARAETTWSPLPLSKIISAAERLGAQLDELVRVLASDKPDIAAARRLAETIAQMQRETLGKLQRPAPEPGKSSSGVAEKELTLLMENLSALSKQGSDVQKELEAWNAGEEGKRSLVFETQRKLSQKQGEARTAEHAANEAAVELARWETRRDQFLQDLRVHRPDMESELNALAQEVGATPGWETYLPKLQKIRSQLEWIGSIDPETEREYTETKERFDFLSTQTEDLTKAIAGLDAIIQELDQTIRTKSDTAFHSLNREFGKAFTMLFGGGEARLLQVAPEPEEDEEGNLTPQDLDAPPAGIDIQATPPGKRLKSIALLSGGERALTSIALISAIMATNPSPFIVLDEVDAALDEANSRKFAHILHSHADKTQFIVISHNRSTMHEANILYGVTLGEDGASQVLSVKLEEAMHGLGS